MTMIKVATIAILLIGTINAKADGLFMGVNWASSNEVRAQDNDGIRAYKLNKPSVQVYAPAYAGRNSQDGICDKLQVNATDNDGYMAYKNSLAVHTLYKPNGVCEPVYYPGFAFWGGEQNMALAPRWNGQPDWTPATFNYMNWTDPRYNPWMRYGG